MAYMNPKRKAIAETFKNATGEAQLATQRDLDALDGRLASRLATLEYRLAIKLGTCIMLATGLLIAAIKL